jgi:hypothetical protein
MSEKPAKAPAKKKKRKRLPIVKAAAQAAAAVEAGLPPPEPKPDRPKLGRPTKYEPRFAEEMLTWAMSCTGMESYTNKAGDKKWAFVDYPMFEEFAGKIGVTCETLYAWATETKDDGKTLLRPDFSYSYARVLDIQVVLGAKAAMSGAMAQNTAALFLKNHPRINWKEKTEAVETHKHEFPQKEVLDGIYEANWAKARALNLKVGRDIGPPPARVLEHKPDPQPEPVK